MSRFDAAGVSANLAMPTKYPMSTPVKVCSGIDETARLEQRKRLEQELDRSGGDHRNGAQEQRAGDERERLRLEPVVAENVEQEQDRRNDGQYDQERHFHGAPRIEAP